MPQHVAERILTSRTAQEGECKQLTVPLADLKRGMELRADPIRKMPVASAILAWNA